MIIRVCKLDGCSRPALIPGTAYCAKDAMHGHPCWSCGLYDRHMYVYLCSRICVGRWRLLEAIERRLWQRYAELQQPDLVRLFDELGGEP